MRAHTLFEVTSTQVHFWDIAFDSGTSFVNAHESELRLHRCQFRNSSRQAVSTRDCPVVEVHDCLFEGNHGGLFTIFSDRIEVIDSQFLGNYTTGHAGALYVDDCQSLMIARCLFQSNFAEQQGGAIFINRVYPRFKESAHLVNCVLRNNEANNGGGIYCLNCHLRVSNCTIINNHARHETGGIKSLRYGEVAIENSILWGNRDTVSGSLMLQQFNTLPTRLIHCCVEDPAGFSSVWGRGVINRNPRMRLGGQLQVGSPCIDAGDFLYYPYHVLDNPAEDVVGNERLIGREIDMGAFENRLFEYPIMESSW